MRTAVALAVATLSLMPARVSATAFFDGYAVLAACETGESRYENAWCLGYITGAVDMYATDLAGQLFCPPPEVNAGQVHDVVVKYLRDHPAQRHLLAPGLVAAAMSEAFPCPSN